jgi:hypothetical protein
MLTTKARPTFPSPNACPVSERTADGTRVGRCYFNCPGEVCPRHGDVSGPMKLYRERGQLTDELDLPKRAR